MTGTPESLRAAAAEVDEGEDARVGVGPPRLDSAGGGGEQEAAEQMEASAWLQTAGDDGVRDGSGRRLRAGARAG